MRRGTSVTQAVRRGTQGHGKETSHGGTPGQSGTPGQTSRAPSPPSGSGSGVSGRKSPGSDAQSSKLSEKKVGGGAVEDIRDKSEQKFREYQKSMTEKIFSAVTVDEQSAGSGKLVKQIEGFPTLNLMRLYQGPWRLNH